MRNVLWIGVIASMGCKPPPEAPTELDDLSTYLFTNFDDEDEEVVAVGVQNLDAFLADKDLAAGLNDRAFSLSILEGEALGTVPATPDADPALQTNVGVWGASALAVVSHKESVSDANQVCAASDSTKYSSREFTTDLACWESGDCRELGTTGESRTESVLANVWMDTVTDFRMVALEDGREAMLARGYLPSKAVGDDPDKSWDQRYLIDAWIPLADGTSARYYAMWSSATIGVGGDTYVNLVKAGIDEYYENTDKWLLEQDCHTDRDAPYTRE